MPQLPNQLRVIRTPAEMRCVATRYQRDGLRVAFVPTMGFLHEGHLELLRQGRAQADILVLSIFVNPTQFGPGEDLDSYPRDQAGDFEKAASVGTDIAFCPEPTSMYPNGYETFVRVPSLALPLCGQSRPGHFDGVATVVTKLFQLTKPSVALFGEKDFQQLALIRRMTLDLDLGIEIDSVPIVREADGLAMSSRNRYLSGDARSRALALQEGLAAARRVVESGIRGPDEILAACSNAIEAKIDRSKTDSVDYIELLDANSLSNIERLESDAVLAVAVFIDGTRLIDNIVLSP